MMWKMMKSSKGLVTAIAAAAGMGSALIVVSAAMAAEADPALFPDYHPASAIIKCPYIPEGLAEVPMCQGKVATCVGTDDNDLIIGTDKDDVIVAGDGNDVVHADAGNDLVCGGPGDDSLFGARGDDTMYGEEGNDWLFGAKGVDILYGGPGDDVLWGGPGIDELDGGDGDYDVCMLQREMGKAGPGCDTQYPPPGYVHEEEPEPGMLKLGKSGSRSKQ
jgi:hypothetical protein